MIRVGLIDDQALVRAGFGMVINSQADMEVVLEGGDGNEAIEQIRATKVDVVLMDVQMPGLDGIAATRRLLDGQDDAPKIVVLTTFDTDEYLLAAIAAGASGFLLKDARPEELLAAIRTVFAGDAVIAPRSTRRLLTHVAAGVGAGAESVTPERFDLVDPLTPRESEVLRAIAIGMTNGEIAASFHLSTATVKTHVGRVLTKTGSRDRVQVVLFAFRTGMVAVADILGHHE
ncbi:response regulator transcription factor [Williamsia sp. 1135]|uniref:response regulator transcription factor n=1 Tax=Williamsia sp. 1135 TaxID=1889262 RepID=UPI000A11C995|nr:response regulator transcription factor [Williamsia sp. 1135]ORM26123.1 DNA-binding response regulator [Williamsia sp. 1135]